MELSRDQVTSSSSFAKDPWDPQYDFAYQIHGSEFNFFPRSRMSKADQKKYRIPGTKTGQEIFAILVKNKLGLSGWDYTLLGGPRDKQPLTAAEVRGYLDDDSFVITMHVHWVKSKNGGTASSKGHFLIAKKKPAAKKKSAAKKTSGSQLASRTLEGL